MRKALKILLLLAAMLIGLPIIIAAFAVLNDPGLSFIMIAVTCSALFCVIAIVCAALAALVWLFVELSTN